MIKAIAGIGVPSGMAAAVVALAVTVPSGLAPALARTDAAAPAADRGMHKVSGGVAAGTTPPARIPAGLQAVIDSRLGSRPVTAPGGVRLSWGSRGAVEFRAAHGASGRFVLRPESVGRVSQRPFSPEPFMFGRRAVTEDLGGGVTAWYKTAAQGFEQGFTLSRRLTGPGQRLLIVLAYGGNLRASAGAGRILLSGRDGPVLAYGGLRVTDARGRVLSAWLSPGVGEVRIIVDDTRAVYPLTVDPYIAPSATPAATFTVSPGGNLGTSVALSANGQIALVGAPGVDSNDGAAYLYAESAGTWPSTPTATFTPAPGSQALLGSSVALSADGSTALVSGGPLYTGVDAAYLYTAASGWSNTPAAVFSVATGTSLDPSVALSANGQTALVGAPGAGNGDGAAYLYTESSGTWPTTPDVTILGQDGGFGAPVALSADGQTALVGSPYAGNLSGAAYAYTTQYSVSSGWSYTLAAAFAGTSVGDGYGDGFGSSLALSGDGQTALIGASGYNGSAGAAYLYTPSAGTWPTTPAAVFTGDSQEEFGNSMALSGDGQVVLIGAEGYGGNAGIAYLYTASSGWSNIPVVTFTDASNAQLGRSVALSGDGQVALIGASAYAGAAYLYAPPSLVATTTSVASSANPATVGEAVTYTATVSGPSGTLPSAGETVAFDDGGSAIPGCGAEELTTTAPYTATCTVTYASTAGSPHLLAATYSGDSANAASTSAALSQTVNPAAPGAPTGVTAVAGDGSATVSWAPPGSDGGSPVTSYTVAASDATNPGNGGQTVTGSASPLTVTGLTGGDADTFTVTATNAAGTSVPSDPSNVVIIEQAPAITSPASTSVGMREPFAFTVTTTGVPVAAITESGALPSGVTFTDNGDGTASLAGTAAAGPASSYPITITASNGVGSPAGQAFTLTVTSAASDPAITSAAADTETFGVPFSFTVTTTGYPAPKITKTGALPAGVTFTDNGDGTATISGTPTRSAVGAYPLTLTAKSTAGTAIQTFTLTITKAPVIKKIPTTTAHVGTALTLTITASGDTTPAITESGTLPAGLTFTDNGNGTATITGTPAAGSGGSYPITITAANQLGTATQTFTLKVDEAPAITSADTATAATGTAFTLTVTTTGFPAPRITKVGSLPAGVTFKAATGTFSGTPKAGPVGSYPVAISATNSSGTSTQNFTLTITGPSSSSSTGGRYRLITAPGG